MRQSLFFDKVAGLRPATLQQVFSCGFCEISKNTFSYRAPLGDCFCNLSCYRNLSFIAVIGTMLFRVAYTYFGPEQLGGILHDKIKTISFDGQIKSIESRYQLRIF